MKELQVINIEDHAMAPDVIQKQVNILQETMKQVMKKDIHYGVIPGCGVKPTLLKPGAEKICTTFRLAPTYDINVRELENGHREYEILCTLSHIPSDQLIAQGVGLCSSMESKYRYRKAELVCPQCGHSSIIKGKEEYGGGWLCWTKKDGCGSKFQDGDSQIEDQPQGKVENEDISDSFNTILKMAKKRAHVDAVLTATAASDIFTQDIEEIKQNESISEQPRTTVQHKKEAPKVDPVQRSKAAINWIDNLVKNASRPEDWEKFQTSISAQTWMLPEDREYFQKIKSAWLDAGPQDNGSSPGDDDLPY